MPDEGLMAQLNQFKFNPAENDQPEIQDSALPPGGTGAAEPAHKPCPQFKLDPGQIRNHSVAGTSLSCVPSSQFMYYVAKIKSEPKALESASTPTKGQRNICGMRPKFFYPLFAGAIFMMIAATVGAVIGTLHRNKAETPVLEAMEKLSSTMVQMIPVPTFTPYPLNTGPWEINEPIDVEEGICGQHPQAIDNCNNPYELKFNILKDLKGYMVETDSGVLNGAYLYPPSTPTSMYSFNVTDWEFEAYFEAPGQKAKCNTTVDASFLLGENYKFHLIFHYRVPRDCEKWNGYTALAGQVCHCEWKGYVFKDLKPKSTTINSLLLTLDPTPTYKGPSNTSTVKPKSTKNQVANVTPTKTVEISHTSNVAQNSPDFLTTNRSISVIYTPAVTTM